MILTVLLYLTDLLRHTLGVPRKGREEGDRVGGVGKLVRVRTVVVIGSLLYVHNRVSYLPGRCGWICDVFNKLG